MLNRTQSLTAALLAAASFGFAGAASAQDAPPVNQGAINLTGGVDLASQYWFRGIAQENQGFIIQPYADIATELYSDDDVTVGGFVGIWNSFHASGGLSGGNSVSGGTGWYEADLYAGLYAESGDFSGTLTYTDYYAPDGGTSFATELALSVAYDDAGLWAENGAEGFALNPSATLAFELSGAADGQSEGIFLGLGIEPTLDSIVDSADLPVSVSFPIELGLSLDDYYEVGGDDDFFGYISIGAVASTPLNNIPAEYGAWEAHVGVYAIILGDNAETLSTGITGGESFEVWFGGGIGFDY